jgi:hypothetical protein
MKYRHVPLASSFNSVILSSSNRRVELHPERAGPTAASNVPCPILFAIFAKRVGKHEPLFARFARLNKTPGCPIQLALFANWVRHRHPYSRLALSKINPPRSPPVPAPGAVEVG